jgi:hypothetical protein
MATTSCTIQERGMKMERLTIDEVIAHCKRHTEGVEKRNPKKLLEIWDMEEPAMKRYWEHRQVAEWLEKLKAYEQAEEDGLLIKLPCPIGTKVFCVMWGQSGLFVCEHEFEIRDLVEFGDVIFLTKAEAEQALAKMKGEEE